MGKAGERDVVAEWQRLMRLWESACASYAAECRNGVESGDADDTPQPADAAIEQARRNLIAIKQQIDSLIAACARVRAADPGSLRFALLDAQATPIAGSKPEGDSNRAGQTAARSSKR